jgi:hypothetical protein
MLRRTMILTGVLAGSLASWAVAMAAPETPPSPQAMPALVSLQPGQWQLKSHGSGFGEKSICFSDMKKILQVQHANASCSRLIIVNEPRQLTVHYKCGVAGHGRTTIKVETPRLVQVHSQGIAGREPFAFEVEARRIGACSGSAGGSNGRK